MIGRWCIQRGKTSFNGVISRVTGCIWLSKSEDMNRLAFASIFLFGVAVAVAFSLLYGYYVNHENVRGTSTVLRSNAKIANRFSPLLEDFQLNVVDEGTIELAIRRPEQTTHSVPKDHFSDSEAVGSLQAALEMKKVGKLDKALKLFKHAAALAPRHPDVLNHYGEFLEETQNNIVLADQLYFQALTYSPEHQGALANRHRTARIVEELDQTMLRRIDNKRDILSEIPNSNRAFRRAKKEAYFQHIYHTVGIEGNTMSLSQTRAIVETQMAVAGKSIIEHNEILGLDAAMKYINATLVNRIGGITVKDILEIHRRVMGFVDPIESGYFRTTQVYVGGHIPPAPSEISLLMDAFQEWLNSESAVRMHPIRYAALAHYKLVHIHPFTDGNGRTSRLLMNTILMQAGFPPVIIVKQDRHKYYEYLELANKGDVRPFVRFIAHCTERTLDLFLWATKEYSTELPALEEEHKVNAILAESASYEFLEE